MEKNVELGRLTFHRNIPSIKLPRIENYCRRRVIGVRKAAKMKELWKNFEFEEFTEDCKIIIKIETIFSKSNV